jgi:hypothetical protein
MTRVLVFEGPKASRRFDLLWAAMQSAGDGKGDRTPAVIRKEARLQDTLESISEAVSGNGTDPTRTLVGKPTLTLSQEDFDLLYQYMEKTQWNPRVSRDVVDAWDWMSAAEKRD